MVPALRAWAPQDWPVAPDWRGLLQAFLASPQGVRLAHSLQQRLMAGATVYPPQPLRALELTALARVKVVILGQDPYHGAGQAQGLAFSVAPGVTPPPSLRNILKELQRDPLLQVSGAGFDGSLAGWARQGVLLLNTSLTVEAGQPASHARLGWEGLTSAILHAVLQRKLPVVFMLWGGHAQQQRALIDSSGCDRQNLCVLSANHPSPLSANRPPQPFVGCGHFSRANQFLLSHKLLPVDWSAFS